MNNNENIAKVSKINKSDEMVNFRDVWNMFKPRWYWFVLSVFVALLLAMYYIMVTPPTYVRSASILIENDENSGSSSLMSDLADFAGVSGNTNMNNEILSLKSPILMRKVVENLRLDENYSVTRHMRVSDLYKTSPIIIAAQDAKADSYGFDVQIGKNKQYTLKNFVYDGEDYNKDINGKFGTPVKTPVGKLIVSASALYTDECEGMVIHYDKSEPQRVADSYANRLSSELGAEKSSIVLLKISDQSPKRAEDVLNELIKVYNNKWVDDKKTMAMNTSSFIDNRLNILEGELSNVDSDISSFKSANMIPDVRDAANLAVRSSYDNQRVIMDLNNKLITAQYIKNELSATGLTQPLPSNTGIDNSAIEQHRW